MHNAEVSGAIGDARTVSEVRASNVMRGEKLQCLGKSMILCNGCLICLSFATIVINSTIQGAPMLLRLARLFKVARLANLFLLVTAIYIIRRTNPVPRGFECVGGCACLPWSLMLFGVLLSLDELKNMIVMIEVEGEASAVPWVLFGISAANAAGLIILGHSWLRAIKEEDIGYTSVH
mmetsp:Transcript_137454/g.383308  ORF Transcript_137454/g.383308 Transcript_137454/m.383308 type:complete len:178 (-) Transcript_137454:99-632(-)|eukprot:CAMPEP_0179024050 /NCGR_PEP_ID=MMETSP0796-20121207/7252_1 /TAXON_ID=73915 /ORGANISM="Pyrodinium bahamense, Strain pbaha01" /LENGTH=177 /DNA_ID=CAMNT_0020719993 /DNA_START=74 /DNA_END=607 /DNA_ORIENTATION=-